MTTKTSYSKYLEALSISTLTHIQKLCLEPMIQGKSVFALAPTGSGKTLSFVLPLLLSVDPEYRKIQKIILTPTRELGLQVAKVCQQVADIILKLDQKNILVRTAFGGSPISKQIDELNKNPHVLVGTPGRILDLQNRKVFSGNEIKTLILDEADIMVGMGFSEQIQTIYAHLSNKIQVGLFSATQNEKVTHLENVLFQNKEKVICDARILENETTTSPKIHDSNIEHQYIVSAPANKYRALVKVLNYFEQKEVGKIIIFCHQKDTVHQLSQSLQKSNFLANAITGDLGQVHRNSIMRHFKTGNLKYLVATNIASRGIDIDKLAAVIHYDVPFTQEDYVHRSGRTGRSGFMDGVSITFCEEKNQKYFLELMQNLNIIPTEIKLAQLSLTTLEDKTTIIKQNKEQSADKNLKPNFIKIYLNKGKQDKIRPTDILGTFIQALSFDKNDIGSIFIFDNFTHVEINENKKNLVLKKSFKLKNISVKATLAKE
jgi:ATP-dependent RNA helicase DeaD